MLLSNFHWTALGTYCGHWADKMITLVAFEAQATKSWHKSGPEVVKREVHRRLKNEGWDSVRPALSTTVRCVIL